MTRATKPSIDPKGWYSLTDIFNQQMFPWVTSYGSVRKYVHRDRRNGNLLDARIKGRGAGKKYHFKGENIINFIKAVEAGTVSI